MSNPIQSEDAINFVDESIDLGEEFSNSKEELQEFLEHSAEAINARDIANYTAVTPNRGGSNNDDDGSPTGQFFFDVTTPLTTSDTSLIFRDTYRKLVRFNGITFAANPNIVAHRINGAVALPNTYIFTRIYGVIQAVAAAPPLWVPIPNDNVHVEVNSLNVSITIPALYDGYDAIVVLEYIKT